MKSFNTYLLFLLMLSASTMTALAQETDPQLEAVLWKRLSLSKKVSPRVSLSLAPQLIFGDNISRASLWLTDFGIGYKVNRNLSLNGTYRLNVKFREGNQANDLRHQLLFNIYTTHRINSKLRLYYRARYQTQSPELLGFMNEEGVGARHFLRNRLKMRYSASYYFRPWVTYELFHRVGHPTKGTYLRNNRLLAGVDYRINNAHKLNFFAGVQNRLDRQDKPTRVILGTTFSKRF